MIREIASFVKLLNFEWFWYSTSWRWIGL